MGSGVFEIVTNDTSGTYRAVYGVNREFSLCSSCLSEEVEVGDLDAEVRDGDRAAADLAVASGFGGRRMNRKHEKATIIETIDEPLEMEVISGNVFADLGFENAAEHLLKAGLMAKIQRIIRQSGLTKKAAAKAMGIDPSKLSKMLVGEFEDDSVELLMRHLVALDVDVEIVVKPKTHETGELRVA